MKGCPVDAYEKDPVTGIVKHLDDQCIGCSYCTLTCPYEVPAFNNRLGIVRKCDMCSDRLAEGEAPACVQGCPNEAISITIVNVADVLDRKSTTRTRAHARRHAVRWPPGASRPTGHAHAHPALAVMLVLTQLSVGAFITEFALEPHERVRPVADRRRRHAGAGRIGAATSADRCTPTAPSSGCVTRGCRARSSRSAGSCRLTLLYAIKPDPAHRRRATAMGLIGVMCSVLIYPTTRAQVVAAVGGDAALLRRRRDRRYGHRRLGDDDAHRHVLDSASA